jgi:hypothetical protein
MRQALAHAVRPGAVLFAARECQSHVHIGYSAKHRTTHYARQPLLPHSGENKAYITGDPDASRMGRWR